MTDRERAKLRELAQAAAFVLGRGFTDSEFTARRTALAAACNADTVLELLDAAERDEIAEVRLVAFEASRKIAEAERDKLKLQLTDAVRATVERCAKIMDSIAEMWEDAMEGKEAAKIGAAAIRKSEGT